MSSVELSAAEPFPRPDRPLLIPSLGGVRGATLQLLVAEGARIWGQPATVALPELPSDLLTPSLGRILFPMCHDNQSDPARRRRGFDQLGLPFSNERYRPRRRLSRLHAEEYTRATLVSQAERGATLLLTPAHHVGGIRSIGRLNDLEMARYARRIYNDEQLIRPFADDPWQLPRRLMVHVLVPLDAILGAPGEELLAACAQLDTDAFLVGVARLDERTLPEHVYEAAWWLGELQRRTGRSVVSEGSGNLHLAFGLEGLAGACVRTDAAPRLRWPHGPTRGPRKRVRRVFHAAALAEVPADPPRDQDVSVADVLFHEQNCNCGRHGENVPPDAEECAAHTLICRLRLWREATEAARHVARARYEPRIRRAARIARRFRLVETRHDGWDEVRRGLQDVRDGRRRKNA